MRTLKYIIGISLAVGLVACDDFLVETPQTALKRRYIQYGGVGKCCFVRCVLNISGV